MDSLMKRILVTILVAISLQGCESLGHKTFYSQVAPVKYQPTDQALVFEYQNVKIDDIYELLFSDFLIVGRSSFVGPYENPLQSISYAKSIGADVLITSSQFKETRTSFVGISTPTSSTTSFSGYSGNGSFYGSATTYGTQTTTVPVSVNRYNQTGLFLKNVNHVIPLWQRTEDQYQKTASSELEGVWHSDGYTLNVYRSGSQIVAFTVGESTDKEIRKFWGSGELKFIVGVDSGVGVYIMGNKTPMPARFKVNKFGHLEAYMILTQQTFSFARQ